MKTTHYFPPKNLKIIFYCLFAIIYTGSIKAQDVAVCGFNTDTNDGFALVALVNIPASQLIFVTDAPYQPASNSFDGSGSANEGTLQITWTGTWTKGTIIEVEETGANIFTVTSSTNGPASPAATIVYAGDGFSLGSEGLAVFSSCDLVDPDNNVVNIYSYVHHLASGAADPNPNDDPDCPCSADFVEVDLTDPDADHGQFMPGLRGGAVSLASYSNMANWDTSIDNIDLSLAEFSDITFGGTSSVSFTAPDDICVSAGVQSGLSGGSPAGGVYSGTGVTDDGNGMTFSFDPAAVGVGTHSITYTYGGGNNCLNDAAAANVMVIDMQTPSFTALADLCINAGIQSGLGGGSPAGGVYSGPGVTDDSNGMTYSFDPATAGLGVHSISYGFPGGANCLGTTSDDTEVFNLPVVTLTLPDTIFVIDGVFPTGIGGGAPEGGIYSNANGAIADDGNGMTFSFNNSTVLGNNYSIIYSYTDANGCQSSATVEVLVLDGTVNVIDLASLGGSISPNPATEIVYLNGFETKALKIFDSVGRLMLSIDGSPSQIDVSFLQTGVYTILIDLGDGQYASSKLVKL